MNAAVAKKAIKPTAIPTVAGTPFAGGLYAGRFFIGTQPYALIVSPTTEGDLDPQPWNKSVKNVASALSYCDGLANTEAMVKAGSALAKSVRALTIGKLHDWYLPSRLESLLLFGALRDVKAFAEKGAQPIAREWYWTSTHCASNDDYAWIQSFYYGSQSYVRKSDDFRARAVRRVKL